MLILPPKVPAAAWQERYASPLQTWIWITFIVGIVLTRCGLFLVGIPVLLIALAGWWLVIWPLDQKFRDAVKKIADENKDRELPESDQGPERWAVARAVVGSALGFILLIAGIRAFVTPTIENRIALLSGLVILGLTASTWMTVRTHHRHL